MGRIMDPQTITAGRAIEVAANLARQLAGELDGVNQKYPSARGLGQESHDILMHAYAGTLPGLTPSDSAPVFERLFLMYIASKYVIVPDQGQE
jgi:hypothetical protein